MGSGDRLGSYVLDEIIGRGSTGVVWRAHADDGTVVAVKILKSAVDDDPAQRAAFLREGLLLAERRIAGAVTVRDFIDDGHVAAIVMDFIPGRTLRGVLEEAGALSALEAAEVAESLAATLESAHTVGITHGDVKPENVVMREGGTPVLMDFGLARVLEEASLSTSRSMTQVAGTPHYLAPEIHAGQRPGRPADIYALGVLLYECVAGRRPFTAPTRAGLATQHREKSPEPTAMFPHALWTVTEGMLAKAPADRPTAAAVKAQLARAAAQGLLEPGDLATTTWQQHRAAAVGGDARRRGWKNRRVAASALAAGAVVLTVVGAVAFLKLGGEQAEQGLLATAVTPTSAVSPGPPDHRPAATSTTPPGGASPATPSVPGPADVAPQAPGPAVEPDTGASGQAPPQTQAPPAQQSKPAQPPPDTVRGPERLPTGTYSMEKTCTNGKASLWVQWNYTTTTDKHYWNEIYYRVDTGIRQKSDIRFSIWVDGQFVPNTREVTSANENGTRYRFRYYRVTQRVSALEESRVEAFLAGSSANPYCTLSVKL